MTPTLAIDPCPQCGGARTNIAQAGTPDLFECVSCGAVESALVGVVDAELLPPPPDEDDLLPPPEDEPIEALRLHLETPEPTTLTVTSTQLEVLPASFELPPAIRFVPNPELQQRAIDLAQSLVVLQITDEASCHEMDRRLTVARAHDAAIDQHFAEPVEYFFSRHRALTTQRAQFHGLLPEAIKEGGRRIFRFNQEQERKAADERRVRQEEADRQAREQAQREADEARKAQAPAAVVEQLEEQAKTVTAPPVSSTTTPRETLKGSAVTTTRKARPKGTEGAAADQQPGMAMLTPGQRLHVLEAMKAVIDGRAPLLVFEINYSYLDSRAKSDKLTFNLPGFELYEVGGLRGKSTRVK
jgi:hypothetical protein